jgi:hypothetical protein
MNSYAQRVHVEDEAVSRAAGITSHRLIHVCQETQDDAKSTLTVQDSVPQGTRSPSRYELHVAIIIQGTDNGRDNSAPPAADVGSIVVECRRCGTQQRAWEIAPPSITYRKLPPCFFEFSRTEPSPAAEVEAFRSTGSRHHNEGQPDEHTSTEVKVISFEACVVLICVRRRQLGAPWMKSRSSV